MHDHKNVYFAVYTGNIAGESKEKLIGKLRRNASIRRVVYPELVWQKSRPDLLCSDQNHVASGALSSAKYQNIGLKEQSYSGQSFIVGTIV